MHNDDWYMNDRNRFNPGNRFIGDIEDGKRYPFACYTKEESDERYATKQAETDITALTAEVRTKAEQSDLQALEVIVSEKAAEQECVDIRSRLDLLEYSELVNPKMFGAVGDGIADDTAAFVAAMTHLRNIYVANSYASPILYIPAGVYNVGEINIELYGIYVLGDGAVLNNIGQDAIFTASGDYARKVYFQNVVFRGGTKHINFNLNNREATQIRFDNCRFYNATDTSCYIRSQSTNLFFSFCHFYKNYKMYDGYSDGVYFSDCWFNDQKKSNDYDCSIYIGSATAVFSKCFFIPSGEDETASEIAYINWTGLNLIIENCRASNERGAKTLINHRAVKTSDSRIGNGISIVSSMLDTTKPVIRLFTMPLSLNISDCYSSAIQFKLIDFSESVDPDALISSLYGWITTNAPYNQIMYRITNQKSRTITSASIPNKLLPFFMSDIDFINLRENTDMSIIINYPSSRLATYYLSDLIYEIEFYGSLCNVSESRVKTFRGRIVFDIDGDKFTPNVSLNRDDITVTALIDGEEKVPLSSDEATTHTISIAFDTQSFVSHHINYYGYKIIPKRIFNYNEEE